MSASGSQAPVSQFRYRFGSAEFDESRFELRIGGMPVDVQRKPLEILALLLTQAGEVVTKEELLEVVWEGRPTVENVVANAITKLRGALGGENAARIVTLPRIGYRFDGPVERMAVGKVSASPLDLKAGAPVPGRPNFQLEARLGQSTGSEVWLARHVKTRERRVYKYCSDSRRLSALKREATLSRLLQENLGERGDFTRVLDWNFETPPFFLECEYGGQDLLQWADEDGHLVAMSLEQRLALFLQVADAVAAAHSIGVLHKDLKPANILIAADGEGWRVRLTDFGSSRLLEPQRLADLGITRLGLTMTAGALGDSTSGTPLYLAPELIAGNPPTVASDVYALGVILYQLVVGDLRRPLVPGWERAVPDALLREDIARATDGEPALRLAGVNELAARLRDLAARHGEKQRRETAAAEARLAREALQRTRARRPWLIAAIGALALGLLFSGLLWQRSEQQRRIAESQAARAEATIRFLSDDLIGALNPGGGGYERDPTIRDMLEYASTQMVERLPADAAIRGSIHAALGQAWRNLGERERGVAELRQAMEAYAQAFGAGEETTLRTRYVLVHTLSFAGEFAEAERELAAADALAGARLREESELALAAAVARGVFHVQQLQVEPALEAWQRADRLQRKLRPDDAHMAFAIRETLADLTLRQGKLQEAVEQLQVMLEDPMFDEKLIGTNRIAEHRVLLARALRNLGRYEEALPLAQAALATGEELWGPDNYSTLIRMSLIASIHRHAGDCASALPILRTVRTRMAGRYGEDRQATLIETGNLGFQEYECGDREAGIEYLRRAESGLRQHYGEDNVAASSFRFLLARTLAREGRWREAQQMADGLDAKALTAGDSRAGWEHRLDALRGEILIGLGDLARGRELLSAALAALVALGTEDEEEIEHLRGVLAAR